MGRLARSLCAVSFNRLYPVDIKQTWLYILLEDREEGLDHAKKTQKTWCFVDLIVVSTWLRLSFSI
jgi:hypothetical protein